MSEGWNILVVDDELLLGLSYVICWKRMHVWTDCRGGQCHRGRGVDSVEQARRAVFGYHDARPLGNRACRDAAEPKNAAGRGVCDGICRVCGRCYNLDAIDYVVKPVEDARLSKALDKIEAALGVRRVVHAPRQPCA